MSRTITVQHLLAGVTAALLLGAAALPGHADAGPVEAAALAFARGGAPGSGLLAAARAGRAARSEPGEVGEALAVLGVAVRRTSHPRALADAFRSYYAYRAAHPETAANRHLYFVDYGLPSTTPRGYLFDMEALTVVEGPFTVAHGRGSAATPDGVPRRFSNASGSQATSLGLYVAQELYGFRGTSAGRAYRSVGLRLAGVSGRFNANARSRGVVAHGAPYVTAAAAGRSEGCPAVEPERARRLLPRLAGGGLVFLFAPDATWLAGDPWLAGDAA
jgi:hypothetical protein